MPKRGQRKCRHCGQLYVPDHRNRYHQKYCSDPSCRKASRSAKQRRWLNSSKGRGYFKGPFQVERVRQWRLTHRGYWRNHARRPQESPDALQDLLITQPFDSSKVNPKRVLRALQDLLFTQNDVLNGLILKLTGLSSDRALQDHIDFQRGNLILLARQARTRGPTHANRQTTPVAGKAT